MAVPERHQPLADVAAGRDIHAQAERGVLMHEAPVGAHQRATLRFGEKSEIAHRVVALAIADNSFVRLKQPGDQMEQRRLARTGLAHDSEGLAFSDLEGNVAAGLDRAIALAQRLGDEKRDHLAASFCFARARSAAWRFSQ